MFYFLFYNMNNISNTKDNMDVQNTCSIPGCNNKYTDKISDETLFVLGSVMILLINYHFLILIFVKLFIF